MLHPMTTPRAARLSAALLSLLLAASAFGQAPAKDILRLDDPNENQPNRPRAVEVVPPAPLTPEEQAARRNVPRAKRLKLKDPKTGKNTYVYKCGDEFTDSPVCTAPVKPSTMKPTAEELARCKTFKDGNFLPWYCR
ncbi:MAG: hypothetical protein JWN73_2757 [Betaproteobacteria bacterium]|nr:hypothetical protein [Betaproteobacteria bacterium]